MAQWELIYRNLQLSRVVPTTQGKLSAIELHDCDRLMRVPAMSKAILQNPRISSSCQERTRAGQGQSPETIRHASQI
jgi:hypothetical protein